MRAKNRRAERGETMKDKEKGGGYYAIYST